MKKLRQKLLTMDGTKKRINDIRSVFQNIEYSFVLLHNSLTSTNSCLTFLYPWGHIIIYSFPQDSKITVEFLYPEWMDKVDKIIQTLLAVFQPVSHKIKEIDR
jgi:hypothetical protein